MPSAGMPPTLWRVEDIRIWSVGHSNHEVESFLALVAGASIEVVADVRSQPSSRFSPQFNRQPLRQALTGRGIRYVFLGRELGGRPPEAGFYDDEGHVLYGEVARSERFREGLQRLVESASKFRVAMLCSEEDPTNCHRRLLLARVLSEQGVTVEHIRGTAAILSEERLRELIGQARQDALFEREDGVWRSTQSVSPSIRPRTSSRA